MSACSRLESGQQELARIRSRSGVVLITVGILLGILFEAFYFVSQLLPGPDEKVWFRTAWAYLCSALMAVLFYSRLIVVSLAPVARDIRVLRAAMAVDALVVIIQVALSLCFVPVDAVGHMKAFYIWLLSVDIVFVAALACLMCDRNEKRLRLALWRLLAAWVAMYVPVTVYGAIEFSRLNNKVSVYWMCVPVQLTALALVTRPSWQQRLRRAVTRRFEVQSARKAAAGVAALVGNSRPCEVLALASARFRSVPLCEVEFHEMADNTPDPALFAKSQPCSLRQCDAFISHSWHDDPTAKWQSMQRWRAGFVAQNGYEPRVWIDKCCIDQRNVERDLRCLPVFLSGCKRLVVFCGPSYLSRLWCVVELFTFVHMGGNIGDISFELVTRPGQEVEDFDATCASFRTFDAEQCTCFVPEEKERMLGIITEAFGDLSDFSRVISDIFDSMARHDAASLASGDTCCQSSPALLAAMSRRLQVYTSLSACAQSRPSSTVSLWSNSQGDSSEMKGKRDATPADRERCTPV
mmetsp:Transcript_84970/g.245700  ORF Transcript_84970/g.245700 Transcript_84970/m.245700 type:complete len:523 (-) Transcript_84970:59-1627(-)